ncbi:MAG: hypothetical protein IT242_10935 [Bacteroidia bacterium]|nr:hypothetical protein [Bacteroidia bacterium]
MKKLSLILVSLLLSVPAFLHAQPYKTGLGLRLGSAASGLTVKHFVSGNSALEGILSFGNHSFLITGLYEKNNPFGNANGLNWFYGIGGHVGFYNDGYHYYYYKYHGNKYLYAESDPGNNIALGIDFILGLEYKFNAAPVSIGLDTKPFVDISHGFYGYWDWGLSVRFTL